MVLYFLHFRVDLFLVKGMIGTAALGYYSLAVVLAETTLLATESLAIAVLPRQIGNSLQDAARLALRGARANGVVAIAAGLLWTVLGAVFIKVFFGPDFSPAYKPLVALLPGIVCLSMERMCSGPTLRAGKSPVIAIVYAGSLTCNVSLNLLLIPVWGMLGASIASSISYGLEALVILAWTARLADLSFAEGIAPRHTDLVTLYRAFTQGIQWVRHHLILERPRA
jgi:O-antigen/teichoic acid export membrane protein